MFRWGGKMTSFPRFKKEFICISHVSLNRGLVFSFLFEAGGTFAVKTGRDVVKLKIKQVGAIIRFWSSLSLRLRRVLRVGKGGNGGSAQINYAMLTDSEPSSHSHKFLMLFLYNRSSK